MSARAALPQRAAIEAHCARARSRGPRASGRACGLKAHDPELRPRWRPSARERRAGARAWRATWRGQRRRRRDAALATVRWPGRLEVLERRSLDRHRCRPHAGRHPQPRWQALTRCAASAPAVLVCGVSARQSRRRYRRRAGARLLHHHLRRRPPQGRARRRRSPRTRTRPIPARKSSLAETVAEARRLALAKAGAGGAIYVAGGLFLAAEFKAAHLGRDPATLAFF